MREQEILILDSNDFSCDLGGIDGLMQGQIGIKGTDEEIETYLRRTAEYESKLKLAHLRINSFKQKKRPPLGSSDLIELVEIAGYGVSLENDRQWVQAMVTTGVPVAAIIRSWDLREKIREREQSKKP